MVTHLGDILSTIRARVVHMYWRESIDRTLWMHVLPVQGPSVPAELVTYLRDIFDPICRVLRAFNHNHTHFVVPIYLYVGNPNVFEDIRTRYPYYNLAHFCLLYRESTLSSSENGFWLGRRRFCLICSGF